MLKVAIPYCLVVCVALLAGCSGRSEADLIASAKEKLAKRNFASAVIELKSALQQSPNSTETRLLLGVALLEQGNAAAAVVELRKAAELNVSDEQLAPKLARALLGSGKAKDVVQEFGEVQLKLAASQAELRTAVAAAYAVLNRKAEAEVAISQALTSEPNNTGALLVRARLLASDGKFDESFGTIERSIQPGVPNGEAHLLRAQLLRFVKRDSSAALKSYSEAALDPRTALHARSGLIQIFLAKKQIKEAKLQLAELQKTNPQNLQVSYLEAVVAYAQMDFGRAEAIVDQLLRVAPDSPLVLLLGGSASLKNGNLIAAETKLGKLVQTVDRMDVARKLLAETYIRMGQPDKALANLNPLLEQAKADGDALALAGQAHLHAGRSGDAEASFAAAAKVKPDDPQVGTALALADLAKGNSESAFDALQAISAKDPGETADLALISVRLRRREFDAALQAVAALEKKSIGKPTAIHLRGVVLRAKGDSAGARASFEQALVTKPEYYASIAALAEMDVDERKFDSALARLKGAIAQQPKNVAARMAQLQILQLQGAKQDLLMASIDEAIKVVPTDPAPRVAKISNLARANDVKGAASAAQDALAALPSSPLVLDAAGRALANAGDDQQALSAFNKLASLAPRSPIAHLRLADLHTKRGDQSAVSASLSRAFEVAPTSEEVLARMLANAIKTKDFLGVLSAAKILQKQQPKRAVGYVLEGDAESARKSWSAAIAAYRSALQVRDGDRRPPKLVHATMLKAADAQAAAKFAADWLRANPKDIEMREYLGGTALLQRRYREAAIYFRDILVLSPKNVTAMNNMAWLMAEIGEKGAVALAEQALGLSPRAAPVMDTLAKALFAERRVEEAIAMQLKSIEAMPERHQYRLNLIHMYLKAGRKKEGKAEMDRLVALGKGHAFAAEVAELGKLLGQ